MTRFHLGLPIQFLTSPEHRRCQCQGNPPLDSRGWHLVSCAANGTHSRHDYLVRTIRDIARSTCKHLKLESRECFIASEAVGERRMDLIGAYDGFRSSDSLAFAIDVTVAAPLGSAGQSCGADRRAGAYARLRETTKINYYHSFIDRSMFRFFPFVLEVGGLLGPEAEKFLYHIAPRIDGRADHSFLHWARQRISCALVKSLVRQLVFGLLACPAEPHSDPVEVGEFDNTVASELSR